MSPLSPSRAPLVSLIPQNRTSPSMADFLRLLSGGAKFNRARFAKDYERKERDQETRDYLAEAAGGKRVKTGTEPPSRALGDRVNFFGGQTLPAATSPVFSSSVKTHATTSGKASSQSKPVGKTVVEREEEEEAEEEEDEEEEVEMTEEEEMEEDDMDDLDLDLDLEAGAEGDEGDEGDFLGLHGEGDEDEEEEEEEVVARPLTLKELQKKHHIHVSGAQVPRLLPSFADFASRLRIPSYLLQRLRTPVTQGGFGFAEPTPIQMQSVPALVAGRELLAFAPTGSGKTLAFALPMLAVLNAPPSQGEWRWGEEDARIRLIKDDPRAGGAGHGGGRGRGRGRARGRGRGGMGSERGRDGLDAARKLLQESDGEEEQQSSSSTSSPSSSSSSSSSSSAFPRPVRPRTALPFRGLVLAPTKELAHQTYRVLRRLAGSTRWRVLLMTRAAMAHATGKVKFQHREERRRQRQRRVAEEAEAEAEAEEAKEEEEEEEEEDEVDDEDEATEQSLFRKPVRVAGPKSAQSDKTARADDRENVRQILVTTPLRLLQLLERSHAFLPLVRFVVFDEADRLFDEGFLGQVGQLLQLCPNPRLQRCMCSATVNAGVEELARNALRDPVRVVVGGQNVAQSLVRQRLVFVGNQDGKAVAMEQLVREGLNVPMLIFVQSKERALQLHDELSHLHPHLRNRHDVLHADRPPAERFDAIDRFRAGKTWVLVCTDLMARGIDFKHVNCVLNYDFPQTCESYIHRIGRTGRAGRPGEALTFVTGADRVLLRNIAQLVHDSTVAQQAERGGVSAGAGPEEALFTVSSAVGVGGGLGLGMGNAGGVPSWMLELPKASAKTQAVLAVRPPRRPHINTEGIQARQEQRAAKGVEMADKRSKERKVQRERSKERRKLAQAEAGPEGAAQFSRSRKRAERKQRRRAREEQEAKEVQEAGSQGGKGKSKTQKSKMKARRIRLAREAEAGIRRKETTFISNS